MQQQKDEKRNSLRRKKVSSSIVNFFLEKGEVEEKSFANVKMKAKNA
jgi:hypothetical protein